MHTPQARGFECPICASQDVAWSKAQVIDPSGVCRNCGCEFRASEAVCIDLGFADGDRWPAAVARYYAERANQRCQPGSA
jgi:transcription elongation factor Elf1